MEDVKAGQFIIEYLGEVISHDRSFRRMKKYRKESKFYILNLDANECIDARHKGNWARFINHSCNPNCETQKWFVFPVTSFTFSRNVNGEIRVGIFALKDIKAGSELTFDYQFERFGGKKQKCYCGEKNCRGYLGAKPKQGLNLSKNLNPMTESVPLKQFSIFSDDTEQIEELLKEESNPPSKRKFKFHGYQNSTFQSSRPFLNRIVKKKRAEYLITYKIILEEELERYQEE